MQTLVALILTPIGTLLTLALSSRTALGIAVRNSLPIALIIESCNACHVMPARDYGRIAR